MQLQLNQLRYAINLTYHRVLWAEIWQFSIAARVVENTERIFYTLIIIKATSALGYV